MSGASLRFNQPPRRDRLRACRSPPCSGVRPVCPSAAVGGPGRGTLCVLRPRLAAPGTHRPRTGRGGRSQNPGIRMKRTLLPTRRKSPFRNPHIATSMEHRCCSSGADRLRPRTQWPFPPPSARPRGPRRAGPRQGPCRRTSTRARYRPVGRHLASWTPGRAARRSSPGPRVDHGDADAWVRRMLRCLPAPPPWRTAGRRRRGRPTPPRSAGYRRIHRGQDRVVLPVDQPERRFAEWDTHGGTVAARRRNACEPNLARAGGPNLARAPPASVVDRELDRGHPARPEDQAAADRPRRGVPR